MRSLWFLIFVESYCFELHLPMCRITQSSGSVRDSLGRVSVIFTAFFPFKHKHSRSFLIPFLKTRPTKFSGQKYNLLTFCLIVTFNSPFTAQCHFSITSCFNCFVHIGRCGYAAGTLTQRENCRLIMK